MNLHPKQWVTIDTPATEILYGGAAGGGKSFLMREAAIRWCSTIPGLQVYLFRRQYRDLVMNHMEGPKGFYAMLASWIAVGKARIVDNEIRFWNGSKIFLCHCHNEKDIYNYQGSEIHVLLIDEITHFTEAMYRYLRGRNRMVGITIPEAYAEEYRDMFPRILVSGNPGGVGHLWVKKFWVAGVVPGRMRRMSKGEGGMLRQFIPARLEDNPSTMEDDPLYEQKLEGLGSAALVKALRWGDWNVIEGAFFDSWSEEKHVISPFTIPPAWVRFRSMDWGFASPFSVGWWAVVQDDTRIRRRHLGADDSGGASASAGNADSASAHDQRSARTNRLKPDPRQKISSHVVLPRGALVRYREYYGGNGDNKGARLDAEVVAARICKMEAGEKIDAAVLDPSTFKHDSGPSIAERINMAMVNAVPKHTSFREADNTRVSRTGNRDRSGPMSGWDQMRARLVGIRGRPMIYCFETCVDSIRTIPVLQHDKSKAEDLDTNMEDHCADDWRYGCSSRPWVRETVEKPLPKDGYQNAHDQLMNDSFKTI